MPVLAQGRGEVPITDPPGPAVEAPPGGSSAQAAASNSLLQCQALDMSPLSGVAPSPSCDFVGTPAPSEVHSLFGATSASRDSGHATSPLLGGIYFGSGELGPYVAPGSGAETDRSASRTSYRAEAAQKQSQQRSAHSSRAEAAQPQQSSSTLNKQAGVYVLQGQKGTRTESRRYSDITLK